MIPKNLKVLVSKTDKCEPSRVWTVQHLVLINFLGALTSLNESPLNGGFFIHYKSNPCSSHHEQGNTIFKKENLINPQLDSHEKLRMSKQEKNCTFLA